MPNGPAPIASWEGNVAGFLSYFATGEDKPLLADAAAVDREYRRQRIRIMLAITLGYGLIYTCRLALGVVKKPLIDAGVFSPSDLGTIGSALFYTYAIGKLTNGFLADHANMKRFLGVAFLLTALCNIAMGFATSLWLAVLLWGLNGWFQSFGAPGGVVAMTNWFSNRERGRAYGVWSTAHSIGEGLTFLVVGVAVSALGWRWGYWGPGLIGIATAIGCFILIQDRPRTLGLPSVLLFGLAYMVPLAVFTRLRRPAVSTKRQISPSSSTSESTGSTVVPATSCTTERSSPETLLSRLDLPTFGFPTSATRRGPPVGRDRDRLAQNRPSSTWSGGRWPSAQKRMFAITFSPAFSRPSTVALPICGCAMTLGSATSLASTLGSCGNTSSPAPPNWPLSSASIIAS